MSRIGTSSTGGNVNIQDTSGNPITSSDGAVNVNVVNSSPTSGTPISVYNEITNVAMASSATVLTYTVPNGDTLQLNSIQISSDSISTIEVDINGSANAKGRLCYTNYNLTFGYNSLTLAAGTIIAILATNDSLQGAASFNATMQGALQT